MRRKLLFILALLCLTVSSAWADWNGGTYIAAVSEEIYGTVNVNANATLTINSGVTVTVHGSIVIAESKMLTIAGGGTLEVHGIDGTLGSRGGNAIDGDVIINGANVYAYGGAGGYGSDGSDGSGGSDSYGGYGGYGDDGGDGSDGGNGGTAFTGQVTIFSGSITAFGGKGGNGGNGGNGGDGGYGHDNYGIIDVYEGDELVGQEEVVIASGFGGDGGNAGNGGNGGDGGYAFTGNLIFYGGIVDANGGDSGDYGEAGTPGTGGTGESGDGDYGDYASTGESGNPVAAFEQQNVTFYAASYTMTGDVATGCQNTLIEADDTDIPVVASGECGPTGHTSDALWSLNILGQLTISGTGAMKDFVGLEAPWYYSEDIRESIKSVVIEEGVTHVGRTAFNNYLPNLTSIHIAASVTSFGTSAIYAVGNLETVTFADGSQLKTIDDYNFNSCNALTTITLPASVTSIGEFVLYNCANLATVILNSSPRIENADRTFGDATVTMNLKANEGATGEYWTTYYNWSYNFQTADDTQIFKAALNGTTLELTELTTDKIVTKNEAVILKSTSPTITLTETSSSSSNNFNDNSLQGVNIPEGQTADDPSHIYVLNKTNAYGVGFYKLKAGKTLGMGKVYLTYIAPSSAKAIDFFAFDTATGIDEVSSKMEDVNGEDDVWYTLDGRRLSSKPTQRGIYIVGGKKVFIN